MRDLTPVGLSKDGTRLVLVSASGDEFSVVVDARLRAALRGENARLGQLEMKMESALRPRDIQARIRAGESPEEVAEAAKTTVDAIMGFATPVLAERAHIAQSAQKSSLRRRSTEASSAARTLGDAAADYFSRHSLHDEDVEWDAWRRQDGRWALVAQYAVDGRPRRAEFTHDVPGRFVVADNDDARMLTGELSPPSSGQEKTNAQRRLSPVPASQDELPLGDDAIELVRDRQGPAAPEPGQDTADADWISVDGASPVEEPFEDEAASSGREASDVPEPEPAAAEPDQSEAPQPVARMEDQPLPEESSADESPAAEAPDAAESPASKKRKGRSSVPSWDEIMFGGGKGD